MKVLCVCPTYGRIPYLGRMMASFVNQTYVDKHLVVINDDNNITLCCDRDDVTILNLNKKILLPEKRNIGSALGFYDLIIPWDDDDIYLPKYIENHVAKYANGDVKSYRNEASYLIYGDKFYMESSPFNAISIKKDLWFDIGGYSSKSPIAEDLDIYNKIVNNFNAMTCERNESEIDMVYHFGGVNYHNSGGSSQESIIHIARAQLEKLELVGEKFWLTPNEDQYNIILTLQKLYHERGEPLSVKHLGDCEIGISHLL